MIYFLQIFFCLKMEPSTEPKQGSEKVKKFVKKYFLEGEKLLLSYSFELPNKKKDKAINYLESRTKSILLKEKMKLSLLVQDKNYPISRRQPWKKSAMMLPSSRNCSSNTDDL